MNDPMLASVIASPEDPTPRRSYAAAIRAVDPVRADFIERQLSLREKRRRGETVTPVESKAQRALLRGSALAWAGPIAQLVDYFAFWGGFVEEVRLDAVQVIAHHAELAALAPIRHLSIRRLAGLTAPVAQLPVLGQLASLDVGSSGIGDHDVAVLATSPYLTRLRSLRLNNNAEITLAGMRALGAANLPALMFVDASGTETQLVARSEDWDGSDALAAWTRARAVLVAELGHRA